jgi:uncharacterized membrane protein YkoI
MRAKKLLLALTAAMALLVVGGAAYAAESGDEEDTYRGSISAPGQGESSLQELTKTDQAAAEQAALKAVPGTVHETELETSDNGYVVYDIEIAGEDGKNHEVKVDAGNGEILHQDLEDEVDDSDSGEVDDDSGEVDEDSD